MTRMGLLPDGRLHMGWRHVLFANWPVEPAVVADRLPAPLSVDTHGGRAWLSVVPFTNVDVRPTWWPAGWGLPLPELNLRTYVTHHGDPGVFFYSLDAEGVLGVLGGRWLHRLPYYYARIDLDETGGRIRFRSRRHHPGAPPLRFRGSYAPAGEAFEAEPGSLEAFLTERYRYYTVSDAGAVRCADVEHEPWPLFQADVDLLQNGLFAANGYEAPAADPVHLYSPVVETLASPSRRR